MWRCIITTLEKIYAIREIRKRMNTLAPHMENSSSGNYDFKVAQDKLDIVLEALEKRLGWDFELMKRRNKP